MATVRCGGRIMRDSRSHQLRTSSHTFTWSRGLIELLIVTAGVLLALALDQWMESRKDRAEEELLLRAVRTELQEVVKKIDEEIVFRNAMSQNVEKIYDLADAKAQPEPAVLDPMLGQLLWWSNVNTSIGAVESILVGGKLRLIENEQIRFFLASLPEDLRGVEEMEREMFTMWVTHYVPYFVENSDLSQIVRTMTAAPGSNEKVELLAARRPELPTNHAPLLRERKFLSILSGVGANQDNVRTTYQDLRSSIMKGMALLDEELGDTAPANAG